ncbi:hypothetical protein THRCLA_23286 [Thraustotheca clavata]|uniref:Crinkler (CRN) family protein n=1 Tax=Thraustotheca clavata TaxID=74557 RepID=A0A1V9Y816_9STRA|nr:hypothetical protein THRCLA_23286 [Thraustotheca clavata]
MLPTRTLDDEEYFGPNFKPEEETLQVLVEILDYPHRQQPVEICKLEPYYISHIGPVNKYDLIIPFDTISSFQLIANGLLTKRVENHPLYLLCGPRQFGNTSIAFALDDLIRSNATNVHSKLFITTAVKVEHDEEFWHILGTAFNNDNT